MDKSFPPWSAAELPRAIDAYLIPHNDNHNVRKDGHRVRRV